LLIFWCREEYSNAPSQEILKEHNIFYLLPVGGILLDFSSRQTSEQYTI